MVAADLPSSIILIAIQRTIYFPPVVHWIMCMDNENPKAWLIDRNKYIVTYMYTYVYVYLYVFRLCMTGCLDNYISTNALDNNKLILVWGFSQMNLTIIIVLHILLVFRLRLNHLTQVVL